MFNRTDKMKGKLSQDIMEFSSSIVNEDLTAELYGAFKDVLKASKGTLRGKKGSYTWEVKEDDLSGSIVFERYKGKISHLLIKKSSISEISSEQDLKEVILEEDGQVCYRVIQSFNSENDVKINKIKHIDGEDFLSTLRIPVEQHEHHSTTKFFIGLKQRLVDKEIDYSKTVHFRKPLGIAGLNRQQLMEVVGIKDQGYFYQEKELSNGSIVTKTCYTGDWDPVISTEPSYSKQDLMGVELPISKEIYSELSKHSKARTKKLVR